MIQLHQGRVSRLTWVRPVCESGTCVEVATEHGYVLVRSSILPLEIVRFTPDEWRSFLADVKGGAFDLVDTGEPD